MEEKKENIKDRSWYWYIPSLIITIYGLWLVFNVIDSSSDDEAIFSVSIICVINVFFAIFLNSAQGVEKGIARTVFTFCSIFIIAFIVTALVGETNTKGTFLLSAAISLLALPVCPFACYAFKKFKKFYLWE